jgi:pyruvate/2-oxoglutarate dehydrogenase complex dihydrolipoamide dehydrogenase (E3) component
VEEYDVVILGGGAGAKLIWGALGHRSVVVEQLRVGGACPFVACVPKACLVSLRCISALGADTDREVVLLCGSEIPRSLMQASSRKYIGAQPKRRARLSAAAVEMQRRLTSGALLSNNRRWGSGLLCTDRRWIVRPPERCVSGIY